MLMTRRLVLIGPSLKFKGARMKGTTIKAGLSRVRRIPTTEPRVKEMTQAADATATVQPNPSAIQ